MWIEPEYDGGCDDDSGEKGVRASTIAGMDVPPVLESPQSMSFLPSLASLQPRVKLGQSGKVFIYISMF